MAIAAMNRKLPSRLAALGVVYLVLTGCDQSAEQSNSVLGRPQSLATDQAASTQTIADQALELSLSSPQAAADLAASSPETVAVAARAAAEQALGEVPASPESAMVKLTAYAQLAEAAARLAPESQLVQEAAAAAQSARQRAARTLEQAH